MARASASSIPSAPISSTRYEWTTTLPESPFYKREYDWSGQVRAPAQVHSCSLCNEELHRTPIFDSLGDSDSNSVEVAGESGLDLIAKKFIHHHFIGVRHENNLKEVIDAATGNTNAMTTQRQTSPPFLPNSTTCITSTQTHDFTGKKPRSSRRSNPKEPTCKVCKASSSQVVGTKTDGSFLLSASHLEQLHHRRSTTKFQELAEKETRLIRFKKPGCATTIATLILEIAAAHDLPNDIGLSILHFVGIQEKTTSIPIRSTKAPRTPQPK